MRQRRALFAGVLAVVVLTVFAVPAFADDTSGAPPAPDTTTTPVDSTVPDTTAVEEAPAEEAPAEEAPVEETPAEEAAVEETAPAAVDVTSEPTDSSSAGDSAPETSSLHANPGTGTTTGGQEVSIIIDSVNDGQPVVPGQSVVVKGRVAIGLLGANVDIVYTIDTSGSTGANGGDCTGDGVDDTILDCEKAGLNAINSQLTGLSGVQVGLVNFGSGATIDQGFVSPTDPAITTAINNACCGGGTNFDAGLQSTVDLFATGDPGNRKVAYFLSDGSSSISTGPGTRTDNPDVGSD